MTYNTQNPTPCNNLLPQGGITGTPAIDVAVNPPALYFVSGHKKVLNGVTSYDYRLNIVRVTTGLPSRASPVSISSNITGFNALHQNQRASLALYRPITGGYVNLYIGFSSHCDYASYQGYVAGYKFTYRGTAVSFLGSLSTEAAAQTLGGVWMVGAAPAVDGSGNMYFSVGNGDWNGGVGITPTDFGDSVLQASPSMAVTDYYTPNVYSFLQTGSGTTNVCLVNSSTGSCPTSQTNNIPTQTPLNGADFDLGSGGVTLIAPNPPAYNACGSGNSELITAGKEGVIYGICYKPGTTNIMGGLDACGYSPSQNCFSGVSQAATETACTQGSGSQVSPGQIAQCFAGPTNTTTKGNSNGGSHSIEAFWAGAGTGAQENYLYMIGAGDHMKAFQMNSQGLFALDYPAAETVPNQYGWLGATPVVSWNGTDPTTAIVWAVNTSNFGKWITPPPPQLPYSVAASAATLYGYAAVPVCTVQGCSCSSSACTITEDFRSDKLTGVTYTGTGAVKFTLPTVAGGMVFVAGGLPPAADGSSKGYYPGPTGQTNVNCSPTATSGTCAGYLFVYGTP